MASVDLCVYLGRVSVLVLFVSHAYSNRTLISSSEVCLQGNCLAWMFQAEAQTLSGAPFHLFYQASQLRAGEAEKISLCERAVLGGLQAQSRIIHTVASASSLSQPGTQSGSDYWFSCRSSYWCICYTVLGSWSDLWCCLHVGTIF